MLRLAIQHVPAAGWNKDAFCACVNKWHHKRKEACMAKKNVPRYNLIRGKGTIVEGPPKSDWQVAQIDTDKIIDLVIRGGLSICGCGVDKICTCRSCNYDVQVYMKIIGANDRNFERKDWTFIGVITNKRTKFLLERIKGLDDLRRDDILSGVQLVYGRYSPCGKDRGWICRLDTSFDDLTKKMVDFLSSFEQKENGEEPCKEHTVPDMNGLIDIMLRHEPARVNVCGWVIEGRLCIPACPSDFLVGDKEGLAKYRDRLRVMIPDQMVAKKESIQIGVGKDFDMRTIEWVVESSGEMDFAQDAPVGEDRVVRRKASSPLELALIICEHEPVEVELWNGRVIKGELRGASKSMDEDVWSLDKRLLVQNKASDILELANRNFWQPSAEDGTLTVCVGSSRAGNVKTICWSDAK